MRIAIIIVLGACYYLGWLPASLVVPALLAVSLLRYPTAGPTRRRGGYIHQPSSVSGGVSPGTVSRVQTYTDSFRQPGPQSEVRTAFTVPLGASRITAPGSYMSEWGFAPGRLMTDADSTIAHWGVSQDTTATAPLDHIAGHLGLKPPSDCGCEDAA